MQVRSSNQWRRVSSRLKHEYYYWGEIPDKLIRKKHRAEINRRGRRTDKQKLRLQDHRGSES